MVGGWFDTVGIGFLTILILVPYLLDDAVGLIPVLQELIENIYSAYLIICNTSLLHG